MLYSHEVKFSFLPQTCELSHMGNKWGCADRKDGGTYRCLRRTGSLSAHLPVHLKGRVTETKMEFVPQCTQATVCPADLRTAGEPQSESPALPLDYHSARSSWAPGSALRHLVLVAPFAWAFSSSPCTPCCLWTTHACSHPMCSTGGASTASELEDWEEECEVIISWCLHYVGGISILK